MRVLSQINNCQQKNKQTNKTKRGAPLLGLAKSLYYGLITQWKQHSVDGLMAEDVLQV